MPNLSAVPKIIATFALATLLGVSVVSCSTSTDSTCEATPSGSHSSSIKVSGDFGKEPAVTMPEPFQVKETERSVLVSGSGTAVHGGGELVTASYAAYNAATGKAVLLDETSTWTENTFTVDASMQGALLGLYKSLKCAHEGDRIVSAVPSSELFGALGVDMTSVGIGDSDTLVFIFDVSKIEPASTEAPTDAPAPAPKVLPTPADWVNDVPVVDLSGEVPVVTLPQTAPPAELQLKVIEEGTGALVADQNASVTVDYQGTSWDSGTIFDQSYTRGEPATFPVAGVIDGFAAAMVGHKVGATVLVTIPPVYAYGEGEINDNDLRGQTLVFLIQIRDVK